MLLSGLGSVRIVKNCDLGLENAAAFSRPRPQFFPIRTFQPANNIYLSTHTIIHWRHSNIQLKHSKLHLQYSCQAFKIRSQHSNIPSKHSVNQVKHSKQACKIHLQHLDMHFKQAVIQFQLSFRAFDFEFDIPFKHLIIQLEHSIRHFHIPHNTPCLPSKILHNLCFPFLLGITIIPRETEDNANGNFWGANKVYYGGCRNGEYEYSIQTFNPNILSRVIRPTSGTLGVERRRREKSDLEVVCVACEFFQRFQRFFQRFT